MLGIAQNHTIPLRPGQDYMLNLEKSMSGIDKISPTPEAVKNHLILSRLGQGSRLILRVIREETALGIAQKSHDFVASGARLEAGSRGKRVRNRENQSKK